MTKNIIFSFFTIFLFNANGLIAQKYFTREGSITFFSDASLEKIEAHNTNATSVLDIESGKFEFAVLIKAFQFEKALMQEHFNENYMESSKFPKASFKGKIDNFQEIDLSKDGKYEVNVSGEMTIRGKSNPLTTKGTLEVKANSIFAFSEFLISIADYDIKIPSVVKDNIAKEVKVTAKLEYKPFKK